MKANRISYQTLF